MFPNSKPDFRVTQKTWQPKFMAGQGRSCSFYHLMPPILEMPYRMGPPVDSVNRIALFQWLNSMVYGRYTYSIHGVYQPTNITGGPILWKSFNFLNIRLDQKQLVQQRTTTANYRVDREGKDDNFYGYKLKPSGFFISKLNQSLCCHEWVLQNVPWRSSIVPSKMIQA